MLKKIRIALSFVYLAIASTLYLPFTFIFPFHKNHVSIVGRIIGLGRYILGIRLKIENKEILDTHPPCVFISNHQDNIDVFFGGATAPKGTVTIGKKAIIWFPFFGLMYYFTGNILIDRKNKKSAFGTMDETAAKIKKHNLSVWIMPEGTRSKGRGVLQFKKGAFVTAIKAQVPIYPVAISDYKQTLNLNKLYAGTVIVRALKPIETKNLTMNDVDALRAQCEELIRKNVQEMTSSLALNKRARL